MERTAISGVLSVDLSWSDIGTSGSIWDASDSDRQGNALKGEVEMVAIVELPSSD